MKIVCVVDNQAVEETGLLTEHGLAFWIETDHGNVLFDTGQSEKVLFQNLEGLNLSVHAINQLVLSHSHYDHTGGLAAVLQKNPNVTLHAHSNLLTPRYSFKNGEYRQIGLTSNQIELSESRTKLTDLSCEILPGLWSTGEIRERSELEGRSKHHFIRNATGWMPDPYLDDLSLVAQTTEGLVVICGCCHAGLLNTLQHVRNMFSIPITTVIGGVHLVSADEQSLKYIIGVLSSEYPNLTYYLNHCTGQAAFEIMVQTFGDRVKACPAGTVIEL